MNPKPDFMVFRASNGVITWPHPMLEGEWYEVHEAREREGRLGELKAAESVVHSLLDAIDCGYNKHESLNLTVRIDHGSKYDEPPIMVWGWADCPGWLKQEIADQDDVDWVALVPEWYDTKSIPWLEMPMFGSAKVRQYRLADETIVVGHHA